MNKGVMHDFVMFLKEENKDEYNIPVLMNHSS